MTTVYVNIQNQTVTFDHNNFSNFTEAGLFNNDGKSEIYTNEDDILDFYADKGEYKVIFEK